MGGGGEPQVTNWSGYLKPIFAAPSAAAVQYVNEFVPEQVRLLSVHLSSTTRKLHPYQSDTHTRN